VRGTLRAAALRHLLKHPGQLALALVGLALGVATITAVDLATASSGRALELSLATVDGPATDELTSGPAGIDERLYVRLASAHPELAFAPIVEGYVSVGDAALELVGIDPLAEATFAGESDGAAPIAASALATSAVRGFGGLERWLTEPGAVIVGASSARALGLTAGLPFEIDVSGHLERAVPIAAPDEGGEGGASLLLTDIAQAQVWLGLRGRLTRIELRVPAGPVAQAAFAQLGRELPAGVELEPAGRTAAASLDMTRAFRANLRAMSLLALLVGVLLIYSAVSFAVLQRRRTFATLRALGATRGEILGLVLAEAAVLGALGAGAGLGAGLALAHGLLALVSRTVNDLYFVVAVTSVSLTPRAVIEALAAGMLTALAAAALPALEAASVTPLLGLKRSSIEARAHALSRRLLAMSLVLALAAAAVVAGSTRSLAAGFVALFLLLLSVAALTPALLAGAARAAARLAGHVSPVARLAFAEIAASLSRTGVAVASLGLAVAAMIGVSIMVGSFRVSLHDWLKQTLRADVYVSAPGPGFARPERRLEPSLVAALAAVRGVSHFSASRRVTVDSPRGPISVDALTLAPESYAGIDLRARLRTPVWPAFKAGAVLAAEPLAWRLRLHPGERLTLLTAAGPRSFLIAGIYREYGTDRDAVLMDGAIYRRWWADDGLTALGLYLSPGATPRAVIPALYRAAAGRQALLIDSNADVRALSMSIFDRTFLITRVLNWLAAGVAAIGLLSSLLAWQLERSRELGVLRALGLTPHAAGALIEAQTLFMGLVAFLAAVPAGLLTALLLVEVVNRRAFGWRIEFHFSTVQLAAAFALAVTAALIAGLYPAWRSAHAPVATEMREE